MIELQKKRETHRSKGEHMSPFDILIPVRPFARFLVLVQPLRPGHPARIAGGHPSLASASCIERQGAATARAVR